MTMRKHAPAVMQTAAARASCLTEFLELLGETNTSLHRRAMWVRLKRGEIDTRHWDKSPRRWYSDSALAAAAARSTTYAGCLRVLGVPVTGGQHAHLARRIRRAGIDTSHFLGQAHNRGKTQPPNPEEVFCILPPGSDRPKTERLRRAMRAAGVSDTCAICACAASWRGEPLILLIDHVSGDWLDNRLENLRFLCPNCHSQTKTWCRKRNAAVLA